MRIGLSGPQDFIALAIRRRWWIIGPFLAMTCAVMVLSKSLPKIYVSQSLVLAQGRDTKDFVVDLIAGSTEDRLRNLEQQVLSRTNLIQILDEFRKELPELQQLNLDEQVEKLRARIHTEFPEGGSARQQTSTYFRISYQDRDAALAQKITSKLTTLFIVQDNKARENQVGGMTDFLTRERDKVAEQLREAQSQLKSMKVSHQFELPERSETNLRTLDILATEARTNAESLSRNINLRLNLERELGETQPVLSLVTPLPPAPSPDGSASAAPENPLIAEYRQKKKEVQKIVAANKPQHPDVLWAQGQLRSLQSKLSPEDLAAAETEPQVASATAPGPASNVTTEPNPRFQTLKAQLSAAETEFDILQDAKAAIEANTLKYKRWVENTPQTEQQISEVLRQTTDLQKKYDEINGNLSKAELSSSLESQLKGSQFTVVDPANYPLEPSKPNKKVVALAGSIGSLVIALIFALVVDIARQRVWTQSEVETFWAVPVLVDIPEILTDGDLATVQKKRWFFFAYAASAASIYAVCLYGIYLNSAVILQKLDPVLQKVVYR